MKPSLLKLQKVIQLEAERKYDDHSVLGGLVRILDSWEAEARADNLSESLIEAVRTRLRDYSRLSPKSRAESLDGLCKRVKINISDTSQSISSAKQVTKAKIKSQKKPSQPVQKTKVPEKKQEPIQDEPEDEQHPAALDAPVTVLPGVGPRNSKTLERLNLFTLRDMLYYFPRRYDDYSLLKSIKHLKYGEEVTVIGTVNGISKRRARKRKTQLVEAILDDGSGSLRITWFNQPWLKKRLKKGTQISVSGKIDQYLGRLVMTNPEWEALDQKQLSTNRIVPVYSLTAKITQKRLRGLLNKVVTHWAPRTQDPLPNSIKDSADLVSLSQALLQIHYPDSWDKLDLARHRLAFDEIFLLQLGVLKQKQTWQKRTGQMFRCKDKWMQSHIEQLPFSLTDAQNKTLQDIRRDFASGHPMNRLLQGDVGSGKTIVAALAIILITKSGSQAAVMAPTSILAKQHYRNLIQVLTSQGVQSQIKQQSNDQEASSINPDLYLHKSEIRLMIGSTSQSEKKEIRDGLADGKIKLIIGTHALLEDPVNFEDLELVIIDEQHRFGVKQRAKLRSKGTNPHLMVMTATPIPRSLALTVYGDLDISVIDEMPPGRKTIDTHTLTPRERERAYSLIKTQIKKGHQAFIIYPLVEESQSSEAKAATKEHQHLQAEVFPDNNVGLLHGQMKPDQKEDVMNKFLKGEFDILVSTSIVEVGVDVPNATVMLIEGANRYGLAQLHQLRGRVGRAGDKSYCLLIPESADKIENERLKVITQTNDGFVLAEHDLDHRGPGEFLGTRQSGYAEFRLANLSDVKLIEKARHQAQSLFENDPELEKPENQLLAAFLQHSWGESTKITKGDIS